MNLATCGFDTPLAERAGIGTTHVSGSSRLLNHRVVLAASSTTDVFLAGYSTTEGRDS